MGQVAFPRKGGYSPDILFLSQETATHSGAVSPFLLDRTRFQGPELGEKEHHGSSSSAPRLIQGVLSSVPRARLGKTFILLHPPDAAACSALG